MAPTATDVIGYIRDLAAAVIGLAILFGANFSNDQVAGILLVVTTAGALVSYILARYVKGNGSPAGAPK